MLALTLIGNDRIISGFDRCDIMGCLMPDAQDYIERARMFEERADQAADPISRQHYREMAAHYRSLSVEHREQNRLEDFTLRVQRPVTAN
jgi:hypothetical protein